MSEKERYEIQIRGTLELVQRMDRKIDMVERVLAGLPTYTEIELSVSGMEGSRAGEQREFGDVQMVWCPPGEFLMGSPEEEVWCPQEEFLLGSQAIEEGRINNEKQHTVELTRGFWLAKYECTQGQWEKVMGTDVEDMMRTGRNTCGEVTSKGADMAMYFVSWDDAQAWLKKMNESHPLPEGWEWNLPTEAQWEYACRAGTSTTVYSGLLEIKGERNAPTLDAIAWYGGNSSVGYKGKGVDTSGWPEKQFSDGRAGVREVGRKVSNAWHLYDMIGNVWEWCADWYGDYPSGRVTDPTGIRDFSLRILRGGGWADIARHCRSAYRYGDGTDRRCDCYGFRPAVVPSDRSG